MIGDVIGKPGRIAVEQVLPGLRDERGIDFVTANGENVAGGMGLTPSHRRGALRGRRRRDHAAATTSGTSARSTRSSTRATASCGRSTTARTTSRARLGHLPGPRRIGARGDQPPGPHVHAADREPVHRRRPPARRGVRAAAADPPGRLPLRADVREERDRPLPRRAGQRRRRAPTPTSSPATSGSCPRAPPTRPTSG